MKVKINVKEYHVLWAIKPGVHQKLSRGQKIRKIATSTRVRMRENMEGIQMFTMGY
jgi:hypothetical protein